MTDKGRRANTTKAYNAVVHLEEKISDARSKGLWVEVGRYEKQLEIAEMKYKAHLAREDIAERKVWGYR